MRIAVAGNLPPDHVSNCNAENASPASCLEFESASVPDDALELPAIRAAYMQQHVTGTVHPQSRQSVRCGRTVSAIDGSVIDVFARAATRDQDHEPGRDEQWAANGHLISRVICIPASAKR